jgi:hypothetical protein
MSAQEDSTQRRGRTIKGAAKAERQRRLRLRRLVEQEQVPTICVTLTSRLGTVAIPGEACGLFTTPVIHQACVDVRRTLAFVNLRYGYKAQAIESHVDTKHGDNWNINDLGISSVSPETLVALSEELFGIRPEEFVVDMLHYVDKQLAHFTLTAHQPKFESIERSCILMTELILRHVYDALGVQRPRIPLRKEEIYPPYQPFCFDDFPYLQPQIRA